MTPLASLIRRLGAEGCTVEQIAAAVEHQEHESAARAALQRRGNAARQARWREKHPSVGVTRRNKTLRDVTPEPEELNTRAAAAPPVGWPADAFPQFWDAYPTKVAKRAAMKAFAAAERTGVTFEALMFGLERYKAEKPHDIPYCHPTTWLNGGRWDDQPAGGQNGKRSGAARSGGDFFSGLADYAETLAGDGPMAPRTGAELHRGGPIIDAEPAPNGRGTTPRA